MGNMGMFFREERFFRKKDEKKSFLFSMPST